MAATSVMPLHVLVAEDNPVNQLFAARLVERLGHTVHLVSNGQLAIDAMQHKSFDVVLMDIGMPVMDGFSAVRELRQRERQTGCHLPVIAVTANATAVDRDSCLAVGMDDVVCKPFRAAELEAAITRVRRDNPQVGPVIDAPDRADPVTNEMPVYDFLAALKRLDGDQAFLVQLAQLFLDTVPEQLQSLRTAMQNRDGKLIGDLAHLVKGSVRHFMAASAYDSAQRLEIISLSGDSEMIEQTYKQLLNDVQRLRIVLRSMLFSLPEASPNSGVS